MTACGGCRRELDPATEPQFLRSADRVYHLPCAPAELLAAASEEYRAIVRKGIRYFVDKYEGPGVADPDVARKFLELGRSIDGEIARRSSA